MRRNEFGYVKKHVPLIIFFHDHYRISKTLLYEDGKIFLN